MRSKQSQHSISVIKRVKLGNLPLFIQLAHKGLEKSQSEPIAIYNDSKIFVVPKDILGVSVSDKTLFEGIDSIELVYETVKA